MQTAITFSTASSHKYAYDKALAYLKDFFIHNKSKLEFEIKVTSLFSSVNYMNLRIKRQLKTRWGKVEVLINYWDKLVGYFMMTSQKQKCKKMSDIVRKLIVVKKDI